jgi:hypothetical protein
VTEFDVAGSEPTIPTGEPAWKAQPKRDQWGRYLMPHPVTGSRTAWQRVTTLTEKGSDRFNLELWKNRVVLKGLAIRPELGEEASMMDVREDKKAMNKIVDRAFDAGGGNAKSGRGTNVHKATELWDEYHDLNRIPAPFHPVIKAYQEALDAHGLTALPELIERRTVSVRYNVGGTFDRIYRTATGDYILADVKTGESMDFGYDKIEAQLAAYEDGCASTGLYDGVSHYIPAPRVDHHVGLVIHMPSNSHSHEVEILTADLEAGRARLDLACAVRDSQKIKRAPGVYRPQLTTPATQQDNSDIRWEERLNAAPDVAGLKAVMRAAKASDEWSSYLVGVARRLASELPA